MANLIPAFDHNLVVPPHAGDPTDRAQLSPYPCSTEDLVVRFGTTKERRALLAKFLEFRDRLRAQGLSNAFQWVDGSFLEDIETRENRPPKDIDVVTVYWGYSQQALSNVVAGFPAFASRRLAKQDFGLDHYSIDASVDPMTVVENIRYWVLLFSHNREGVWKGMLKIDLNRPSEDAAARIRLQGMAP